MAAQHSARDAARVAIITGASSGIGLATSHALAARGVHLVLAARGREALRDAERSIGSLTSASGAQVLVVECDVGLERDVHRLVDAVADRFGRLDVLVNNAAWAKVMTADLADAQTVRRAFEVNAMGPAWTVHRAWPLLSRAQQPCIVSISSLASMDPFPSLALYGATKAALNSLAWEWAQEGRSFGLRSFALAFGAVETPLLRSEFDEQTIPRAACLSPDQAAQAIVDCIDGAHDPDNGRTIGVLRGPGGMEKFVSPVPGPR